MIGFEPTPTRHGEMDTTAAVTSLASKGSTPVVSVSKATTRPSAHNTGESSMSGTYFPGPTKPIEPPRTAVTCGYVGSRPLSGVFRSHPW
ncbi:hypothetical protein GCM10022267_39820 [Lentzea roselyniae]|uniref:Uncharacterized protein n=1 Tax=Lentzea roselyniae TaxID=531940 RepID=A0ABP7B671_9PSEU